VAESISYLST